MKPEPWTSVVASILLALLIGGGCTAGILYATSAEAWYADQHDALCERMLNNAQECECCNAFVYLEGSQENPGRYPHYVDCARKKGTAGCRCHLRHAAETERLMK